ncbi:hypothetical protein N7474_004328 [Penicillium riverlandense]|uniref:uncharacterized protein n=1 Tax=Penicillium riverlandense TaxID=1903569 RepID=UPI002546F8CD|nr:uncharacterized protein N7474_004328 [Penicillium riverlandense]KAJ5818737.1 hypothetical protein N7474_004328 [Penicillium riverlandense]
MEFNLEAARIPALPDDAFYISDFITEEEETRLLQKIASAPLPRWTQLTHRRLQTWPSALTKTNTLLASPLPQWLVNPIIEPRLKDLGIFSDAPHQAPNHVLVNEYKPGQGIMPHEDGTAYYPLVATVSLGAGIVLDLYPKDFPELQQQHQQNHNHNHNHTEATYYKSSAERKPQYRILQERRSLLVTRGKIYSDFLHGIAETKREEHLGPDTICNWGLLRDPHAFRNGWFHRETRTSLTYRDVLKVAAVGNTMKFLGRGS